MGRKCAVVRMPRGGGGGLSVGVANAAGSGTLADPGIGSRARRFQREFLRGDGGGVQQTRHRPVELLQQHLEEEERLTKRGVRRDAAQRFLTCVAGMSLKGTCPLASSQAVIPRL